MDMIESHNERVLGFLSLVVKDINETNSSKEKQERLAKYAGGPLLDDFHEVLRWGLKQAYSPYIKFGVTSKQVKKWMSTHKEPDMFAEKYTVGTILKMLENREVTGHNALKLISDNLMGLTENSREVFYNILDKNLKIRMDAKSINKVIPGLIPVFEVSLCNVYADRKHKVNFEKDEWYASRKLDGCVSGDTLISVEGGKNLPIKTIVENKMDVKVLTYNTETNKTEYKPIKNHMKNMDDVNKQAYQWFELELEDGRKLKVTGNHKIYLPELQCWRRVDELIENDKLLVI